jgi:hypothetical protein
MKKFIYLTFILTTLMTLMFTFSAQAAVEQPISFLQDDTEWGSESYSIVGSRSQTIATSGCGPTSMAMVLNYYVDDSITPLQTSIFALENNHRTRYDGTSWAYFQDMAQEYDLEFLQTASSVEALEWMNTQEDPLVICSMGPGLWTSAGHFIVLWDVEDGIAHINDPASTKQSRTENSYNYMASQCKQYFCFNKKPLPTEIVANELVTAIDEPMRSVSYFLESPKEKQSPLVEFMKPLFGNNSYLF